MENRSCPICESRNTKLVVHSAENPRDLEVGKISELFVGLRPEQIFFPYFECSQCNLVYCEEYFTKAELDQLYSHMPPNLVCDELDVVDKTHDGYARTVINRLSSPSAKTKTKTLLELGADLGLVTGPVVSSLNIERGVLVEPNLDVRRELKQSVNNNPNFEIINDFSELDASRRFSFDVVIGVHVFDHLLNPKNELREIGNYMRAGARLFIVVHNQRSLLAKFMGSKWPPYCLQHPQIFSPSTLTRLLYETGFKVNKINRTTNYVGLRNGIRTLFRILGLPCSWTKFLPNMPIPIKYGNIMVEAEKEN